MFLNGAHMADLPTRCNFIRPQNERCPTAGTFEWVIVSSSKPFRPLNIGPTDMCIWWRIINTFVAVSMLRIGISVQLPINIY